MSIFTDESLPHAFSGAQVPELLISMLDVPMKHSKKQTQPEEFYEKGHYPARHFCTGDLSSLVFLEKLVLGW